MNPCPGGYYGDGPPAFTALRGLTARVYHLVLNRRVLTRRESWEVPIVAERVAYVNGRVVPESAATVSIYDRGFLSGHGVFERTRTFRGELFRLDEHLARLFRSMRMVHLEPDLGADALKELTIDLVERNRGLLGPNDDYSVGHFITRGVRGRGPTVVAFCEPIDFPSFAREYLTGGHVVSASTRALPTNVLDPKLKTTSRLHFWLAEQEAHLVDPEAYPLVLDLEGNVCELSAANFWIIRNGTIVTPPDRSILVGITRMVILELADHLGIPVQQVNFQVYDVVNADEAFLTTTSRTILPVTRANGSPIGSGKPGPLVKRLQQAWIERFGFDFIAQALAHLEDRTADRSR